MGGRRACLPEGAWERGEERVKVQPQGLLTRLLEGRLWFIIGSCCENG